jgi:hypothetical protein
LCFVSLMSQQRVAFTDLPRVFLGRCPLEADEAGVAAFVRHFTGVEIQRCKVLRPRGGEAAAGGGTTFARIDTKTSYDALLIIAYADGMVWGACRVTARPVMRGEREVRPQPVAEDLEAAMAKVAAHVGPEVAAGLGEALGNDAKTLGVLAAFPCFLLPYARAWNVMSKRDPTETLTALLARALLPLEPRRGHFYAKAIVTGQQLRTVMMAAAHKKCMIGAAAHKECRVPPPPEVILEAALGRDASRKQQLLRDLMRAVE